MSGIGRCWWRFPCANIQHYSHHIRQKLHVDSRSKAVALARQAQDPLPAKVLLWQKLGAPNGGSFDEITGFVTIMIDPEPAVIASLYVDPAHWRAGVGTLLLGNARRELTAAGRNEAELWVLAGTRPVAVQ